MRRLLALPTGLLVVLVLVFLFFAAAGLAGLENQRGGPHPGAPAKPVADTSAEMAGRNVTLVGFHWRKGGFETVMIATFTIVNGNEFPIKDLYVACELDARSGTAIGYTAITIYDTVPARGRKTFRELNMGSGITLDFNQAQSAWCKLGPFSKAY